jgi:hypothetical protein
MMMRIWISFFLCSLPSSYANFRDTLLYSHDTLTFDEVSEVLHAKENMK